MLFASLDIRQDSRIHTKAVMAIAQALPGDHPNELPASRSPRQKIVFIGADYDGKVDVDKNKG